MAYTTLAAVKAELNISDTTQDTLLNGYIATAQRIIEAPRPLGSGRVFEASGDTTRSVDAPWAVGSDPDGPAYVLSLVDVGDLCAITTVVNGDGTTILATEYVTEPRSTTPFWAIRLKRGGDHVWTYDDSPEGAIAITGRWAYSTAAPADIARCALRIAVWLYRSKDNAGFDDAVQTEQGIILPARMPRDIRDIIEAYQSVL